MTFVKQIIYLPYMNKLNTLHKRNSKIARFFSDTSNKNLKNINSDTHLKFSKKKY